MTDPRPPEHPDDEDDDVTVPGDHELLAELRRRGGPRPADDDTTEQPFDPHDDDITIGADDDVIAEIGRPRGPRRTTRPPCSWRPIRRTRVSSRRPALPTVPAPPPAPPPCRRAAAAGARPHRARADRRRTPTGTGDTRRWHHSAACRRPAATRTGCSRRAPAAAVDRHRHRDRRRRDHRRRVPAHPWRRRGREPTTSVAASTAAHRPRPARRPWTAAPTTSGRRPPPPRRPRPRRPRPRWRRRPWPRPRRRHRRRHLLPHRRPRPRRRPRPHLRRPRPRDDGPDDDEPVVILDLDDDDTTPTENADVLSELSAALGQPADRRRSGPTATSRGHAPAGQRGRLGPPGAGLRWWPTGWAAGAGARWRPGPPSTGSSPDRPATPPPLDWRAVIAGVNDDVLRTGAARGASTASGTTLLAAVIGGPLVTLVHVGDSRAYRLTRRRRPQPPPRRAAPMITTCVPSCSPPVSTSGSTGTA